MSERLAEIVNSSTDFMKTETDKNTQEAASLHALDMPLEQDSRTQEITVAEELKLLKKFVRPLRGFHRLSKPGRDWFVQRVVADYEKLRAQSDQRHIVALSGSPPCGGMSAPARGSLSAKAGSGSNQQEEL